MFSGERSYLTGLCNPRSEMMCVVLCHFLHIRSAAVVCNCMHHVHAEMSRIVFKHSQCVLALFKLAVTTKRRLQSYVLDLH